MRTKIALHPLVSGAYTDMHLIRRRFVKAGRSTAQGSIGWDPHLSLRPVSENADLLPPSVGNPLNRPTGLTVSDARLLKDGGSLPTTPGHLLHAPQHQFSVALEVMLQLFFFF